jgi:hypothetical protein
MLIYFGDYGPFTLDATVLSSSTLPFRAELFLDQDLFGRTICA